MIFEKKTDVFAGYRGCMHFVYTVHTLRGPLILKREPGTCSFDELESLNQLGINCAILCFCYSVVYMLIYCLASLAN